MIYPKNDREEKNRTFETPLVTSENGRSSSNPKDCKFNGIRTITYDNRESKV